MRKRRDADIHDEDRRRFVLADALASAGFTQSVGEKDAVSLFERYAKGGEDTTLKDWAGKAFPAPQHHLQMAKTLDKNPALRPPVKAFPATENAFANSGGDRTMARRRRSTVEVG